VLIHLEPLNVEQELKTLRETKQGKIVKCFVGDGEKVNIANEQFELYLCNMCVMLTNNPQDFFNEASRILKPGGQAVFSIWGRKEDYVLFNAFRDVIANVSGVASKLPNFDLHDNIPNLKSMLEKAGFKGFRKEYTNCPLDIYNHKDYMDKLTFPFVDKLMSGLTKEQVEKVKVDMDKLVKDFENSENFVSMNVLVFSVFK